MDANEERCEARQKRLIEASVSDDVPLAFSLHGSCAPSVLDRLFRAPMARELTLLIRVHSCPFAVSLLSA
jgi:hypothetical protein